ncbi:hypothetical protein ADK41_00825 [Streptomyces caelestis]|uniref:Uncharacterized protein n=1 Tax=Streptomyces caelestis TaxID=36816 RepID=A0A0M8QV70_9ACTN|nr:hypothetical protein ADK41_00825 [Streptomyces caelestis]
MTVGCAALIVLVFLEFAVFVCSSGPSMWLASVNRTARSRAAQTMILEWTKCRRGPRISQIPSSGSRHSFSTHRTSPVISGVTAGTRSG